MLPTYRALLRSPAIHIGKRTLRFGRNVETGPKLVAQPIRYPNSSLNFSFLDTSPLSDIQSGVRDEALADNKEKLLDKSSTQVNADKKKATHSRHNMNYKILTTVIDPKQNVLAESLGLRLYYKCLLQVCEGGNEGSINFFYTDCNLSMTFMSWFQTTALHIWMLQVRIRALENTKLIKGIEQSLVDCFFDDAKDRMRYIINIKNASIIKSYLNDLYKQYSGLVFAYDEAIAIQLNSPHKTRAEPGHGKGSEHNEPRKGDMVLASAIWRNIFAADSTTTNFAAIADIVKYIRCTLKDLDQFDEEKFLDGDYFFKPIDTVLKENKD